MGTLSRVRCLGCVVSCREESVGHLEGGFTTKKPFAHNVLDWEAGYVPVNTGVSQVAWAKARLSLPL